RRWTDGRDRGAAPVHRVARASRALRLVARGARTRARRRGDPRPARRQASPSARGAADGASPHRSPRPPAGGEPDRDPRLDGAAAAVRPGARTRAHLVGEPQRPLARPRRALARSVQVGGECVEAAREAIHQRPPLGRRACARVQADDSFAGSRLAIVSLAARPDATRTRPGNIRRIARWTLTNARAPATLLACISPL